MRRRRLIGGLVVLFLGVVFLLTNLGIIPYDFGKYWPVILIIIGLGILFHDKDEEKKKK